MVEQRTENPRVLGSIPSLGTFFVQKIKMCAGDEAAGHSDTAGGPFLLEKHKIFVENPFCDRFVTVIWNNDTVVM